MNIYALIVAAVIGIIVTWVSGYFFVPFLKKLKYGQTILDIGPSWHKETKQGTPTMGGFMFVLGTVLAFIGGSAILFWSRGNVVDNVFDLEYAKTISSLLLAILFGAMGFFDDYIKVKKKQNEGLTVMQKLFLQALIISAYFTANFMAGDTSTFISIPFLGGIDLGFLYYPLMALVMIYLVNAVNLTDGLDGLCSSVTFIYMVVFAVILSGLQLYGFTVLSVSVAGAMLGFLVWNFYPAKVFMGDTGSLFLGGIVVGIGVGTSMEFLMIIACAVYIWEALSVVIQVTYFKATKGKRLFLMTPIHHSFEKRGWKEPKIVALFTFIAVIFGGITIALTNFI